MLAWLAWKFGVPAPSLTVYQKYPRRGFEFPEFHGKQRKGFDTLAIHCGACRRIYIKPEGWENRERANTILHEFAHYLDALLESSGKDLARRTKAWTKVAKACIHENKSSDEYGPIPTKENPHGKFFTKHLAEVVKAWRGDPLRYPWRSESRMTVRWARRLLLKTKADRERNKRIAVKQ